MLFIAAVKAIINSGCLGEVERQNWGNNLSQCPKWDERKNSFHFTLRFLYSNEDANVWIPHSLEPRTLKRADDDVENFLIVPSSFTTCICVRVKMFSLSDWFKMSEYLEKKLQHILLKIDQPNWNWAFLSKKNILILNLQESKASVKPEGFQVMEMVLDSLFVQLFSHRQNQNCLHFFFLHFPWSSLLWASRKVQNHKDYLDDFMLPGRNTFFNCEKYWFLWINTTRPTNQTPCEM